MFRKNRKIELTDEELLLNYKESGKSDFIGELFDRYAPLLYGVCLKYLQDADRSQDAVMQLFEDLLNKISNYEIELFRTWIYSVVKNHCLQILRKEDKEILVDFNADFMEYEQVMYLLEEEESYDRTKVLKPCLGKLPEQQRVSIIYFFMDELSYADIADRTGYTLSHVKSYIQNGKRNLKICIEKNNQ